MQITQSELIRLLHYNPKTGIFTRLVKNTNAGSGFKHHTGYIYIYVKHRTYAVHRLAWLYMTGSFPINDIDHINGVKDDNRFINLRDVPVYMNMQNERKARSNSTSGFMGVSFRKDRKKWIATIRVNNKPIRLGTFLTPEEAHRAYIEGKRKFHAGFTL